MGAETVKKFIYMNMYTGGPDVVARTTLMLLQWLGDTSDTSLIHPRNLMGILLGSLCGGNGTMKEETQGSLPSQLIVQQLIKYTSRVFSDEKVVELQYPLKSTEMVKTNSKNFSVREASPLEQRTV